MISDKWTGMFKGQEVRAWEAGYRGMIRIVRERQPSLANPYPLSSREAHEFADGAMLAVEEYKASTQGGKRPLWLLD